MSLPLDLSILFSDGWNPKNPNKALLLFLEAYILDEGPSCKQEQKEEACAGGKIS